MSPSRPTLQPTPPPADVEPAVTLAHVGGTSAEERAQPFPGDDLLVAPNLVVHRGVTVSAPASILWRWLCQLRVAPYSYDWVDNRGRRSPRELTPGLDHLQVGQRMMTIFELVGFAPDEHLILRMRSAIGRKLFGDLVVSYLVVAQGPSRCRLLVRLAGTAPAGAYGRVVQLLLPWGDVVMMRRQLLTLAHLAEASSPRR